MNPRRQVVYGIGLLSIAIVVGTMGYVLIEGVPVFDAFYMVFITVSTVGFQQAPLVNPGPDVMLNSGERLVVVGTKDQVDRASELLKPRR